MKTFSLKIPDALDSELDAAAQKRGVSKSELVRRAVVRYLPGERPKRGASLLERAGDLVGCLEGPGDLSTNPRHLRGYGE